ncbi:DUF4265 domain-containing protein [Streptomyces sp. NPDC088147]|uniref:DUF4265 domain-containing protein n=1 Tax=Streptomyces sp. NPDC088147 TaxID=3365830 RepID=UPI003809DD46
MGRSCAGPAIEPNRIHGHGRSGGWHWGDRMDKVKVVFPLERDADGYPPVDVELAWATPLDEPGLCRLENIPFYAVGVSLGDEIGVSLVEGRIVFNGTVRSKGHATIRVVVFNPGETGAVIRDVESAGGRCEVANIPNLIAVDVSDSSLIPAVRRALGRWLMGRKIDVEESNVRVG